MEELVTANAVRFRVNSVIGPNGQGIAIEFTVYATDGKTQQRWPSVYLPTENARHLAQAIETEIQRLKQATN